MAQSPISASPLRAAVVGHPIGHSMSPFLHRRLSALSGREMDYRLLDVENPGELPSALQALDCCNVTIPYKAAVLRLLDECSPKAAACGSVNTVWRKDGRLCGDTTDGEGCALALAAHGLDLSGQLLLLGNGGAARAVAFEIAQRQPGFHLCIACRTQSLEKARALACELAAFAEERGGAAFSPAVLSYEELEAQCLTDNPPRFDLLLNTTSVGMLPNAGVSPVSARVVERCAAVFDAVYNPAQTELLRLAKEAGKQTVGGMEMLVYQAAASHRCWYGAHFAREDLERLAADAQAQLTRQFGAVVLCGFMGSGKSTVGPILAELLGRGFVDLDAYLEAKAGMTVSDIFALEGETGFRARESRATEELSRRGGAVIAAGGGTVLFPQNVEALKRAGGRIVLLDVPLPVLRTRLDADRTRPLLQRPDRDEAMERLFTQRLPRYRAAADRVVNGNLPPEQVAREILRVLDL